MSFREVPKTSEIGVKNLRARFENKATAQTPEKFLAAQKMAAEKEAAALVMSRKKAAAFNMAMRQLELKQKVDERVQSLTTEEKVARDKLRQQARRVSTVLRKLDDAPEASRPVAEGQQRRATQLMLASMAEDLEAELKREEQLAHEEERKAHERLLATKEKAAKEDAKKLEEEMARIAEQAKLEAEAAARVATLAKEAAEKEQRDLDQKAKEAAQREEQERVPEPTLLPSAETYRAPPASSDQSRDRAILTSYLRENYPEKLDQVEVLLEQFKGNLDVLFEELSKDQTFEEDDVGDATDAQTFRDDDVAPEPSPTKPVGNSGSFASAATEKSFLKPGIDLKSVISNFYQIYAPTKLDDIDDILKHFANREADLFRTLEVKYDVEFNRDGTCRPIDADRIGEPFLEAASSFRQESKFAVDVSQYTLKDRLKKQGAPPEKVDAVMSTGSGMM